MDAVAPVDNNGPERKNSRVMIDKRDSIRNRSICHTGWALCRTADEFGRKQTPETRTLISADSQSEIQPLNNGKSGRHMRPVIFVRGL